MTTTATAQVATALSVSPEIAAKVVGKMTETTVKDAFNAGLLPFMAKQTLDAMAAEIVASAATKPPTKDERVRAFLAERGINISDYHGERKLAVYTAALAKIEAMDAGTQTEESKVLRELALKSPENLTTTDAMRLGTARNFDATQGKPVTGSRAVAAAELPATTNGARMPAFERLRQANLLSDPTLSRKVREVNNLTAKLVRMPSGIERSTLESYLDGLKRQARQMGAIV